MSDDMISLIAEARDRYEEACKAVGRQDQMATAKMLLVASFVPKLADALESACLTKEAPHE